MQRRPISYRITDYYGEIRRSGGEKREKRTKNKRMENDVREKISGSVST